jgi:hypothetical protein
MSTSCNHCGAPGGGPGAVEIRILDDQGLEQFGQVMLCPSCSKELGLWLHLGSLPADPPETEADDDQGGDVDDDRGD